MKVTIVEYFLGAVPSLATKLINKLNVFRFIRLYPGFATGKIAFVLG